MLDRIRAAKRRLHGGVWCPACGRPILIEDEVERYMGKAHHVDCVRFRRRVQRPSGRGGSLRSP